jgi:hypothetical protein
VLQPVRSTFRALVTTVVPEADALDESGWAELEAIVADAITRRPPATRRQLLLFLRVLRLLPLVRWGRPLERLDPARRARFLAGLERSRVFLLRRGFWGVRTLAFMGYYARPAGYRAVGYHARLRGWLEHPAGPASARTATLRRLEAEGMRAAATGADASISAATTSADVPAAGSSVPREEK